MGTACPFSANGIEIPVASSAESGWVLEWLRGVLPWIDMHIVRKAAHFAEFFLLGLLLWGDGYFLLGGRTLPMLAAGLAAAALDEGIQTAVPGRSGQLRDVLLDFAGVCAAFLVLSAGKALLGRSQRNRRTRDGR